MDTIFNDSSAYPIHAIIQIFATLIPICACLTCACYTDIKHLLIYNIILILTFICVMLYGYYNEQLYFINGINVCLLLLALESILSKLLQKETLGMGDIKVISILSIILTFDQIFLFFLYTGILIIISYVLKTIFIHLDKNDFQEIPALPAIYIAWYICIRYSS